MTAAHAGRLSGQEWWSPADRAALDAVARELAHAVFVHRERCLVCSTGGPWCDRLVGACEAAFEWRDRAAARALALALCATEDLDGFRHRAELLAAA